MTLDELKSQVETAIRQMLLLFNNNKRETIDFVVSLIEKLMNVEFNFTVVPCVFNRNIPPPDTSKEDTSSAVIHERQSSPDYEESGHISPIAIPPEKQGVKKRKRILKKIKVTNELQSKDLCESQQTNEGNNKTSVYCCICAYSERSRVALCQHISEHAGAGVSCRVCRHTFNNLTAHALHLALRSCASVSACNGQQFDFQKTKYLEEFNLKKFSVCPFCAQSYSKPSNLRLHMKRRVCFKREKSKRKTKHKCPWCKHEFSNRKKCDEHVKNSHTHKCTKCEKEFRTVSQMKAHRVTHVNNHECNKCGKSFPTRRLLRAHSKEQHNKETTKENASKEHRCETCGWKTNRLYNLTRHTQSRHGECAEDSRTYACDRCPAVLRSWSTLKNHIAAHSDEMAFICDHCKKVFKYRMMLVRHMRLHGASAPLHRCARCLRTFGRRDHLLRHQQEVHEMRRKIRPKLKELKRAEVKGGGGMFGGEEGARGAEAEPQFLSLLDVQSGEMFTVPSQYAYNYLMVGQPEAPLGGEGAWEGMPQEAAPEVNVQYADNIVLLTNVSTLPCIPPP